MLSCVVLVTVNERRARPEDRAPRKLQPSDSWPLLLQSRPTPSPPSQPVAPAPGSARLPTPSSVSHSASQLTTAASNSAI
ncbi:unnamed protein product, partial [Tilletia controversa]